MGWLFSHPTREALIAELIASDETEGCTRRVIAYNLHDNILWSVFELVPKVDDLLPGLAAGEICTLIGCDLLDVNQGRWGHKFITEHCGPYYWSCPLAFLELATHGINETWREAVRQYHRVH